MIVVGSSSGLGRVQSTRSQREQARTKKELSKNSNNSILVIITKKTKKKKKEKKQEGRGRGGGSERSKSTSRKKKEKGRTETALLLSSFLGVCCVGGGRGKKKSHYGQLVPDWGAVKNISPSKEEEQIPLGTLPRLSTRRPPAVLCGPVEEEPAEHFLIDACSKPESGQTGSSPDQQNSHRESKPAPTFSERN